METVRDLACPELWQRSLERVPHVGIRPATTSIDSTSAAATFLDSPPKDLALAHDATASGGASGGAAHTLSGGAAPPAPHAPAAASRVPGTPQPAGHPSTGGSVIED